MPHYKVVFEAHEPLLLGENLPGNNFNSSRSFIAGSVLRGGLAKAILTPLGLWPQGGQPAAKQAQLPVAFQHIFLTEPLACFGFLYPVRRTYLQASQSEAFPLPLTTQTCKAHKGFKADGQHGVFDRLMSLLPQSAQDPIGGLLANCPICQEPLDRLRGFGVRASETYQAKANPRTFVRVGLNRWTETAEEGILYTLEALVPALNQPGQSDTAAESLEQPLSFTGYLVMSAGQWTDFKTLLADQLVPQDGGYRLRLGADRSRGMGAGILYLPDEPEPKPDPADRLAAFQPCDDQGQQLDTSLDYFSLTLRAPTLLYDTLGRPTGNATSDILAAYLPPPPQLTFLPQASVVEYESWSGWSAAWGLPKPITPAIAAGSVLTFCAPASERPAVVTFLQTIEQNGLGERRAEGWGEAISCDPFHMQFKTGGDR